MLSSNTESSDNRQVPSAPQRETSWAPKDTLEESHYSNTSNKVAVPIEKISVSPASGEFKSLLVQINEKQESLPVEEEVKVPVGDTREESTVIVTRMSGNLSTDDGFEVKKLMEDRRD